MLSLSKVIEETPLIRYNHIVLQLSKCLKSETIWGGGGGEGCTQSEFEQRDITRPLDVLSFTEWRMVSV